ncbi:MAG: hypothetical protein ABIJ91_05280 [Candidatus Kuenenbacteria bacterium]
MKNFFIIIVLLALFLAPVAVYGQSDTTFFYFEKYRSGQMLQPAEGWTRFDSLMSATPDSLYDVIFVGTADMATNSYRDLKNGVAYESVLQRPLNLGYAQVRANVAKNRTSRGLAQAEVMEKASERGIFVIRIAKPQPPTKPELIWLRFGPDSIRVYVGQTYEIGDLIFTKWSDGLRIRKLPGLLFKSLQREMASVDLINGQLDTRVPGICPVVASYKGKSDTLYAKIMPLPCGINGHFCLGAHGSYDTEMRSGLDAEIITPSGLAIALISDWTMSKSVYKAGVGYEIKPLCLTPYIGAWLNQNLDYGPMAMASIRFELYKNLNVRIFGGARIIPADDFSDFDFNMWNQGDKIKWEYETRTKEKTNKAELFMGIGVNFAFNLNL